MKSKLFRSALMVAVAFAGSLAGGFANEAHAQSGRLYRVEAFSSRTFTMDCSRGETTEIGIVGDGDNDLDLYVYDQDGRLLAYDEDSTDRCYVRWTARAAGRYLVKVVNRGRVYSEFAMVLR